MAGGITPLALVAMTADDFLTNEEREDALRKGRHSLVLSAAHTFSEVLFDVSTHSSRCAWGTGRECCFARRSERRWILPVVDGA